MATGTPVATVALVHSLDGRVRLILTGTCLLCACANDSARFADNLATAKSWLATADMTGHMWLSNRVPTRFARQVLDEARGQLEATRQSLTTLAVDATQRDAAAVELRHATEDTDALLAAVAHDDARGAFDRLPRIGAHMSLIDSLAARAKRTQR